MSRNRNARHSKSKITVGEKGRQVLENIDENNRVIQMFLGFRKELDEKHDRYEKIVKLSRDITIENKRIIFLLHSTNTDIEGKRQAVLDEACKRLKTITDENFKTIASLLKDFDSYQYQKAYTSGLQEFIEALVFYQFLHSNKIETWEFINKSFQYEQDGEKFCLLFPQVDFVLGIADFTGELMRRCINNLGVGNVSDCFKTCNFVKDIYSGFLGIINPGTKEMGRKIYVLKQSLAKMELVCYNIQIRGSEIPKHMLVNVIESSDINTEEDEGFY
ncbi:translin-associated protein X [Tribolium madens]|uniref:translin-associated protein X n=1 Tax=Tribolium madens TaxID=41895 RepID=UPI001CF76533|nr:translin-associated protein X [Tribolium madens]